MMMRRSIAAMMLVVVMGITAGALAEAASDTSSVRQSLTAAWAAARSLLKTSTLARFPRRAEPPQGEAIEQGKATEQGEDLVQEQPYLVQITEDDPSIGYVLVQMQNTAGLLPLPQEGEYTKTIRQQMPDGSEAVNVLHITPTGFWMEESNCEGQDCIGEGEVTLENRQERILGNMVICLPHQMVVYLISREEAEAIVR